MKGRLEWMTQASQTQGLGRPLPHGDVILAADLAMDDWRSVLYCLSAGDGHMIWQTALPEPGASAVGGAIDGVVFFYRTYEEEGHVRAYSVENGDVLWDNERLHWAAVIGHSVIAASWSKGHWSIALVEPRTGDFIWRGPAGVGEWPEALAGDTMVLIEESGYQQRSVVVGARLEDGAAVWRTDLRRYSRVVAAAADDAQTYCAVSGGWVVALDVGTGEVAWARQLEGGTPARPVVLQRKVYTTTQGFFHALDAETGDVVTRAEWKGLLLAEGCVDERYYYAASNDCLVAFDLETGKEVWRHEAQRDESFTPPRVDGGRLYATTLNGRVYCFEVQGAR